VAQKKLPSSCEHKRPLIEPGHPALSVRRQCELLGLSRSSLDYEPGGEAAEDLRLMRRIDERSTACPFYGSRRTTVWLTEQGERTPCGSLSRGRFTASGLAACSEKVSRRSAPGIAASGPLSGPLSALTGSCDFP
jgi:hypothetical protein